MLTDRLNFREYNEAGVAGRKRSDGYSAEESSGATTRRGTPRDGRRRRTGAHATEGTPGDDGATAVALGVQSDHHAAKRT